MREDGIILGTKWRPERQTKVLVHGLTSTVWLPPIVNMWSQHIFEIKDGENPIKDYRMISKLLIHSNYFSK